MTPATALTAPRGLRVAVAAWVGAVMLVAGIITTLLVVPRRQVESPGLPKIAVVEPGAVFVIGSDPSALVLRAELDAGHAANVQPGEASFRVRGLARSFRGTVRSSSLALSSAATTRHEVVLDVANADGALRSGLRVVVTLSMSSEPSALRVPFAAITRDIDDVSRGTVSLVDGTGQVHVTPVEVGVSNDGVAEVRGGALAPGARALVPR